MDKIDLAVYRETNKRLDPLRNRLIASGHCYGLLLAADTKYHLYYGQDLILSEADPAKLMEMAEKFVGSKERKSGDLTELDWAYRIFWA
jgi:hypothetical protein